MELYFKQSTVCVYRNLTDIKYPVYTTYKENGQALISEHPLCTQAQISQGYLIESIGMIMICAFLAGLIQRSDPRSRIPTLGAVGIAVGVGAVLTLVINFITMIFPVFVGIVLTIGILAGIVRGVEVIGNPMNLWREYRAQKEQKIQTRFAEAQAEIARLRASDPVLNDALKSLDGITTALIDG